MFAVIVVYKVLPDNCPSLHTLLRAVQASLPSRLNVHIRVVDNTPGGQDPGPLPLGVEYCASPENPGLSKPYNQAWHTAESEGYSWLLTLDQDTHLPETFFQLLEPVVRQYQQDRTVATIVPRIVDRGRPVSPLRYLGGFLPVVVPADVDGRLGKHALAFNSAALVRVDALRTVGGYDEAFPLHNSDSSLFLRLDQAGKRVVLANAIVVSHELAIMDRGSRMSGDRYRSMLADERLFWDLHMGFLARVERTVRLTGRVAKDIIRGKRGDFMGITLQEIRCRLLTCRRSRIARYNARRTVDGMGQSSAAD